MEAEFSSALERFDTGTSSAVTKMLKNKSVDPDCKAFLTQMPEQRDHQYKKVSISSRTYLKLFPDTGVSQSFVTS